MLGLLCFEGSEASCCLLLAHGGPMSPGHRSYRFASAATPDNHRWPWAVFQSHRRAITSSFDKILSIKPTKLTSSFIPLPLMMLLQTFPPSSPSSPLQLHLSRPSPTSMKFRGSIAIWAPHGRLQPWAAVADHRVVPKRCHRSKLRWRAAREVILTYPSFICVNKREGCIKVEDEILGSDLVGFDPIPVRVLREAQWSSWVTHCPTHKRTLLTLSPLLLCIGITMEKRVGKAIHLWVGSSLDPNPKRLETWTFWAQECTTHTSTQACTHALFPFPFNERWERERVSR